MKFFIIASALIGACSACGHDYTYEIQSGDSFYDISQRYGCDVTVLNPGINPTSLQVGDKINVPDFYTIQARDTVWDVCKRNGYDFSKVKALNSNIDLDNVMVGKKICVPGPGC